MWLVARMLADEALHIARMLANGVLHISRILASGAWVSLLKKYYRDKLLLKVVKVEDNAEYITGDVA